MSSTEKSDNLEEIMPNNTMKILLLNTQMEAGGAQKAMLTLAKGLQAHGHTVQVVTMYDKTDCVEHFSHKYGMDIIDLQMKHPDKRFPLVNAIKGLWRLHLLLRRGRFDILQTFSHYSNIIGPVIAWLSGTKIRVTSQRMLLEDAPDWLLWLRKKITNSSLVTVMVTVSEGTRYVSIRQGSNPQKLTTIHNGVDTKHFSPIPQKHITVLRSRLSIPDDTLVVTTVARLFPIKGHRILLQAVPNILTSFPHTRFLLAGEGESQVELEEMVEKLGLQESVLFLGVRHDIPELLSLSDIFVLPSLSEGFPNALLEAMAVGLPVVATKVGGVPEIITEGETGLMVPPTDAGALTQAICRLLGDPELRQRMGRAGRQWVIQEFSEEKNIASFLNLYTELSER